MLAKPCTCGTRNTWEATACKTCGEPLGGNAQPSRAGTAISWAIAGLGAIAFIGALAFGIRTLTSDDDNGAQTIQGTLRFYPGAQYGVDWITGAQLALGDDIAAADALTAAQGNIDCPAMPPPNDDLQGGQVVVKDAEGAIVGTGTLSEGRFTFKDYLCVMTFTVTDLPASDFYVIEVPGAGNGETVSRERLDQDGWTVELTLQR
jgi:hypothetical protein